MIEVGDKVGVRRDVTVEELAKQPTVTGEMVPFITGGNTMTVKEIDEYGDVMVKENRHFWNPDWLKIIEKKKKTKYFDARKTSVYKGGFLLHNGIFVKLHGMDIEKIDDASYRQHIEDRNYLTDEEPEPLHIIKGEVE